MRRANGARKGYAAGGARRPGTWRRSEGRCHKLGGGRWRVAVVTITAFVLSIGKGSASDRVGQGCGECCDSPKLATEMVAREINMGWQGGGETDCTREAPRANDLRTAQQDIAPIAAEFPPILHGMARGAANGAATIWDE